jgi:quinol monooxygenase YgiN
MYGTVARLRVKPGMAERLKQDTAEFSRFKVPGYVNAYLYQMDADSNEYYLAVLFTDKRSYVANAENPEQNERYQKMRALLTEDPEWHDGEVVQEGK